MPWQLLFLYKYMLKSRHADGKYMITEECFFVAANNILIGAGFIGVGLLLIV